MAPSSDAENRLWRSSTLTVCWTKLGVESNALSSSPSLRNETFSYMPCLIHIPSSKYTKCLLGTGSALSGKQIRIHLWAVVKCEIYLVFQKSVFHWGFWRISVFAPCMISWKIRICTWHLSWQSTGWMCWCFTTESASRFKVSWSVWRNNWGKGSLGTVKFVR